MEFDILVIVQHVLNIIVLFIILRAILYNPVRKFMLERARREKEKQDCIDSSLKKAEALVQENEIRLSEATANAKRLSDERLALADENAQVIIARARESAAMLMAEARDRIVEERQSAREQLEKQTAELAIALAQRILKREISQEDNRQLIEEYFREVG